jgi:hypothetical protein
MFRIMSVCKGGGYRYCRTSPRHPKANAKGLYPLHRVLMENVLGRLLKGGEDVHHKDEDKLNDAPGNLELRTHGAHAALHHPAAEPVTAVCTCGRSFSLKPHVLRRRAKRSKGGRAFCSPRCAATFGPRKTA